MSESHKNSGGVVELWLSQDDTFFTLSGPAYSVLFTTKISKLLQWTAHDLI
jgi:hypothetical protein